MSTRSVRCRAYEIQVSPSQARQRAVWIVRKRAFAAGDPAGEYYDDYYAVFFLDPDGLKLEASDGP